MSSENHPSGGEFIIYQTDGGRNRLDVRLQGGTVCLSRNRMAGLCQRDRSVISRHIKNVFEEGEPAQAGTVAISATALVEGSKEYDCRRTLVEALPCPVDAGFERAVWQWKERPAAIEKKAKRKGDGK